MPTVYFDIETLPIEKNHPRFSDKIEAMSAEEYRATALDGAMGRLLCVSLIIEGADGGCRRKLLGMDKATKRFHLDEARTLTVFWRCLQDLELEHYRPHGREGADLLVGANILDFDIPFLLQRSMIHGVRPTVQVPLRRYCSSPVYDVMWMFTQWRRRISLDALAKAFGLESSKGEGIHGASVYDFFTAGRHEEIARYAERDTLLVKDLYRRMCFLERG